jgi:6-phosphogluconolactonase
MSQTVLCCLAAIFIPWLVVERLASAQSATVRVYVGTYTGGDSRGIYRFDFNRETGEAGEATLAAEATNPSFLAIHPNQRFLYAVGEIGQFEGISSGSVSAYAIEASGDLRPINSQPSRGAGPCHLVVDGEGRNVLVANYGGGSAAVLPIRADGGLDAATGFIQHEGTSINPSRQEGPHAHSINLDANGRFAFVADLGLDKILVYRFDGKTGTITPHAAPFVRVAPGGGPRHFAIHPSGRFAYTNNEITSSVTAFVFDGEHGLFGEFQTASTLPDGFEGDNSTAEIRVHPSGKYLYVSNRGHDSVAAFAIDSQSGRLTPLGHTPTEGQTPRNFNLDKAGQYLIAANQNSHNLTIFRVDEASGRLRPTGQQVAIPSPVCVRFLE